MRWIRYFCNILIISYITSNPCSNPMLLYNENTLQIHCKCRSNISVIIQLFIVSASHSIWYSISSIFIKPCVWFIHYQSIQYKLIPQIWHCLSLMFFKEALLSLLFHQFSSIFHHDALPFSLDQFIQFTLNQHIKSNQ